MSIDRPLPLPPGYNRAAPEIAVEAVPNCPVCGSAAHSVFARGHDYELETSRNEWQLQQCSQCGTVWLNPRPAVRTLGIIYPSDYYAYAMSQTMSPIALRGKEILDKFKFAKILACVGTEPKSFLDIGCGDGRYLNLFAKRGVPKSRIYGLELSEQSITRLRAEGFRVHAQRVEDCTEIVEGTIELATMFHVIEHVADPVDVMRRVADWLKPGGIVAIETPNVSSLDARLFKDRWWGGYHFPRHWTLFDENSLRRLFEAAGLEVVHVGYQTGHSFWMWSFHHAAKYNSRRPSPRFAAWFDPRRALASLLCFTGFDIVRRLLRAQTSAILMIGRKRG